MAKKYCDTQEKIAAASSILNNWYVKIQKCMSQTDENG